jgi:uncharacterized DUF497 family protein
MLLIDDIIWLDNIVHKLVWKHSVFFIKKLNNKALIVTARDMNKSERKKYEKK